MARFSERQGIKQTKRFLQIDSMTDDLRRSLWNALALAVEDFGVLDDEYEGRQDVYWFCVRLWLDFYKAPMDELPNHWEDVSITIKRTFLEEEWSEVYDLVEAIIEALESQKEPQWKARLASFKSLTNHFLEREMSAYRVLGSQVTAITSEGELTAIEEAKASADKFKPAVKHIETALGLMSDRKKPDYRNSIKESISAVEAACQIITGDSKATLGQALKALEAKGVNVHPSLRLGFDKLYGWTSDAEGIRHAMLEEPTLGFDDAKFMLVTCSAFLNFLKAKAPSQE